MNTIYIVWHTDPLSNDVISIGYYEREEVAETRAQYHNDTHNDCAAWVEEIEVMP